MQAKDLVEKIYFGVFAVVVNSKNCEHVEIFSLVHGSLFYGCVARFVLCSVDGLPFQANVLLQNDLVGISTVVVSSTNCELVETFFSLVHELLVL